MIGEIELFHCNGPIGNEMRLNINQILLSQDYEGFWPHNTHDLVKIVGVMVQRIIDRADRSYQPFFTHAWNMLAGVTDIQNGRATPRAAAGCYVVLTRIFNTTLDTIHDGAAEILLRQISTLHVELIKALTEINQSNLHATIAANRRKNVHVAA